MECYYHPDREGADTCAICGKSICKECGLEIAGKVYCKECLEKIVGLGIANNESQPAQSEAVQDPARTEPARLDKQPEGSVYQTQAVAEEVPPAPEVHEIKQIRDDSPYNIKDNIEYSGGIESPYGNEPVQPQRVEQPPISQEPQIAQNERVYRQEEIPQQAPNESAEFIYPDHSYDPEPTSARRELEDRYEKYLDNLYFDDNVPLGEQLAKDEEQYGSLTRKEYPDREETPLKNKRPRNETPEEMEARIRAEILAEKKGGRRDKNIHNLNYQEDKEPMSVIDILLTILLVIVILVVIYYLVYVFILHAAYPTFMDAIYALSNPQNVINNILSPPTTV